MPLTKIGKEILRIFQKEYGRKQGKSFFFAWENKNKKLILKKKR